MLDVSNEVLPAIHTLEEEIVDLFDRQNCNVLEIYDALNFYDDGTPVVDDTGAFIQVITLEFIAATLILAGYNNVIDLGEV